MSFNFALILFWLMVGTGVIWFVDRLVFAPGRKKKAKVALDRFDLEVRNRGSVDQAAVVEERRRLEERLLRQPGWIEFPAGFFPVILVVFLLRSFLFEPFRIPSGSMIPTLLVGDLILVNKYTYGIRLPILNKKVLPIGDPQRGDVMVFRYPVNPTDDYVKRVIGLPGDTVVYRNKRLTVNGALVDVAPAPDFFDPDRVAYSKQFTEKLPRGTGVLDHMILVDDDRNGIISPVTDRFPYRENCVYSDGYTAITCKVPDGYYFVMGDNRDNSADSRYWGFVPDGNIVGKAFLIWMNFGNIGRIGWFH